MTKLLNLAAVFWLGLTASAFAQASIGQPLNPTNGGAILEGMPVPNLNGPNEWRGRNITPPVILPDSAFITPNASSSCYFRLTLTGNNHVLNFPVGIPPQGGEGCTFEVTQDSNGPYTFLPVRQYKWPSGGFALSAAANTTDIWGCTNPPGLILRCGTPQLAEAPTPATILASSVNGYNTAGSDCLSSGSGGTACTVTMTLTQGSTLFAMASICGSGTCAGGANPTGRITSITASPGSISSCVFVTGTSVLAQSQGMELWKCLVTGSGSTAVTINYNATVYYIAASLMDVNGYFIDEGVGNTANAASGSTPSVSTTTLGSQPDDFLVSFVATETAGGTTLTPGSGWAGLGGSNQYMIQYRTATSAAKQTANATLSSSVPYNILVAAFR